MIISAYQAFCESVECKFATQLAELNSEILDALDRCELEIEITENSSNVDAISHILANNKFRELATIEKYLDFLGYTVTITTAYKSISHDDSVVQVPSTMTISWQNPRNPETDK